MIADPSNVIVDFVDLLMPELTPHEASMYMFLFRHSHIDGRSEVRIGQRTIAEKYGRGPKMSVPSRAHVLRQIKQLEEKGCIKVGDTTRDGTLYTVLQPKDIPVVREKLKYIAPATGVEDYFSTPDKRTIVFERDNWICQYCGERVSAGNASLDHYVPRSKDGDNSLANLRTACLTCNSVKSGKLYEEAAALLLRSIKERKERVSGNDF